MELKILAISDVVSWNGFENVVLRVRPNVVCLAGDLASDGFAFFENRKSRKSHVENFYGFLRTAGARAKVLVIRGNHDEDYADDYLPERINATLGCREISGKIAYIDGYIFLGLGFREARNLRNYKYLQSLIDQYSGKVDIILMHDKNVRYASFLKPKLIIKGGFTVGECIINGVPTIFTGPHTYAIIEMNKNGLSRTEHYNFTIDGKHEKVQLGVPPFYKKFDWVKPIPCQSQPSRGRRCRIGVLLGSVKRAPTLQA